MNVKGEGPALDFLRHVTLLTGWHHHLDKYSEAWLSLTFNFGPFTVFYAFDALPFRTLQMRNLSEVREFHLMLF